MRSIMARRATAVVVYIMVTGWMAACGGETGPDVDPAVEPFVGTWDADSLTLTHDTIVADILDNGGTFSIVVEPSGQYTATLVAFGQPHPEIGQMEVVSSSTLRLVPSYPAGPAATSAYVFAAPDSLILDGDTEFDFNFDGTPEPAEAHFELKRR